MTSVTTLPATESIDENWRIREKNCKSFEGAEAVNEDYTTQKTEAGNICRSK